MLTKESRNDLKVAMKSALVDQANMLTEGSEFVKEFVLNEATYEQLLNLCFNGLRDEGVYMESEELEALAYQLLEFTPSGKGERIDSPTLGAWRQVGMGIKGPARTIWQSIKNPTSVPGDVLNRVKNMIRTVDRLGTGLDKDMQVDLIRLSRDVQSGKIKTGKEFQAAKNKILKAHGMNTLKAYEQVEESIMLEQQAMSLLEFTPSGKGERIDSPTLGAWRQFGMGLKGMGRTMWQSIKDPTKVPGDILSRMKNNIRTIDRLGSGLDKDIAVDFIRLSRDVQSGKIKTAKEYQNAKNKILKAHGMNTLRAYEQVEESIMLEDQAMNILSEEGKLKAGYEKAKELGKAGWEKAKGASGYLKDKAVASAKKAGEYADTAGAKIKRGVTGQLIKSKHGLGAATQISRLSNKQAAALAAGGAAATAAGAGLAYKKMRDKKKSKQESALYAAKYAEMMLNEDVRDIWLARAEMFAKNDE